MSENDLDYFERFFDHKLTKTEFIEFLDKLSTDQQFLQDFKDYSTGVELIKLYGETQEDDK